MSAAAPALAAPGLRSDPYAPRGVWAGLESAGMVLLAVLWILPLAFAVWAAFHTSEYTARFVLGAPLTLENFARAWAAAPFARYFLNTFVLVTGILLCQFVLGTLAAYAFARFAFAGRGIAFALVLAQLMIMPDVLIVENYRTVSRLGLVDTIPGIALPYVASAFGIFLLRQTFRTIPKELDDAARVEGANALQILLKVYVPLARPIYVAYGLVSVSYHWNNFLWPLIITNSVEARPLTVGLQIFSSADQGIDWSIICAATLMTSAPLLVGFLLFQRQFVQSFMRPASGEGAAVKLVTWNIQWGLGMDGRVDLAGIVAHARGLADFDVLCLQEVSDGMPDLRGSGGLDQFAEVAGLLPGFRAIEGVGVEIAGEDGVARRFGNMVLSRLPVRQVLRHQLPWFGGHGQNMPRLLIEALVTTPIGPVRVMTTHLEYSSSELRSAQVEAIRAAHADACDREGRPRKAGQGPYAVQPGSPSAILTGDLNMKPEDQNVARLQDPVEGGPALVDAWTATGAGAPHPPSFCIADQRYGPPHCADYVFVSEDLVPLVSRVSYDTETRLSDHQPVVLELEM